MELVKISNPKGLTLHEICSILQDSKFSSNLIYNSCFTVEYSEEILNTKLDPTNFEPIDAIYEDCGIIAGFDFGNRYKPLTVEEFLSKLPDDPELTIKRDVDDGFRYSAYETMLVTAESVVFC